MSAKVSFVLREEINLEKRRMALEAVVLKQGLIGFNMKEIYDLGGGDDPKGDVMECCCPSPMLNYDDNCDANSSSLATEANSDAAAASCPEAVAGRRKRPRSNKVKNKEEVENQRMTHIAVERNRRKQMNKYLAVLRSLMPASYVQRGDQASVVGGAINFVKELEQLVQYMEAHKRIKQRSKEAPFADLFTFPQYCSSGSSSSEHSDEATPAAADIEVNVVDSHAKVKIFSRWRPRQLLRLALGLQSSRLTTLHLNVTTVGEMVLYCFSLKVEDGCIFTSVDAIATAVHQIVLGIEEESARN